MKHRRTGGREGEHSEVTDNFTSLVFGHSRNPLYMDDFFLTLRPKNSRLVHRLPARSLAEQQETDGETRFSLYVRVAAQAHLRVSVRTFF